MNRLYLLIALACTLVSLVVCAIVGADVTTGLLGLATALVGALAGATWPTNSANPGSTTPLQPPSA
jgi:hypothetical protein